MTSRLPAAGHPGAGSVPAAFSPGALAADQTQPLPRQPHRSPVPVPAEHPTQHLPVAPQPAPEPHRPPHPEPGAPDTARKRAQRHDFELVSVVCGVSALFLLEPVLALLAVIFGGTALTRVPRETAHKTLAMAGAVLGVVALLAIVVSDTVHHTH